MNRIINIKTTSEPYVSPPVGYSSWNDYIKRNSIETKTFDAGSKNGVPIPKK